MKLLIQLPLCLLFILQTSAQIILSQIPPVENEQCKILGGYIPRDGFKKTFPNFLNDGFYAFSYDLMISKDWDRTSYTGYYKFNSTEFPVEEQKSEYNLSSIGNINFQ